MPGREKTASRLPSRKGGNLLRARFALAAYLAVTPALANLESGASEGAPARAHPSFCARWDRLVLKYSLKRRLNPNLVKAVIVSESSCRPGIVSDKGAVGLMQVMPETAAGLGSLPQRLADPETNIRAGTAYLRSLFDHASRTFRLEGPAKYRPPRWVVGIVLAEYHAGPSRLHRRHWPRKTRRYVRVVLSRAKV
jgi:soluble lytic murein transglycosylase-like protein